MVHKIKNEEEKKEVQKTRDLIKRTGERAWNMSVYDFSVC